MPLVLFLVAAQVQAAIVAPAPAAGPVNTTLAPAVETPAPQASAPPSQPAAPVYSAASAPLTPALQQPVVPTGGLVQASVLNVEGNVGPVILHAGAEAGLGLRTRDGNWSFSFGFVTQPRYDLRLGAITATSGFSASGTPGSFGVLVSDFEARMLRPQLRMNLLRPWIRLFVQPELAGTPRMLDLQLDVQPVSAFGVRFGQFITPFSRAFITPIPLMQFPDFSFVNTYFRGDRAPGAMVYGNLADGRVEYNAGFFNANGLNQGGNPNLDEMVMGRLVFNPLGALAYNETLGLSLTPPPPRFSIGLNAYYSHVTTVVQQVAPPTTAGAPQSITTANTGASANATAGLDVAVQAGPWYLDVEAYYRSTWATTFVSMMPNVNQPQRHQFGGFLQTGGFVVPHRFELSMRASWLNSDLTGVSNTATPGVSNYNTFTGEALATLYVVGNHFKLWGRYMLQSSDRAFSNGPAGVSHQLTLQAQLFL